MHLVPPVQALGVVFALASALVWGAGDFSGGMATRRSSAFQVLALSALAALAFLVVCAVLTREVLPPLRGTMWSLLAGLAGALGIASLYRALSLGHAAVVAPTSGVLGAAVPVVFGMLAFGVPAPAQLAGLVLALLGIWLVSGATLREADFRQGFLLACASGVGFGGFFVFIGLVDPGLIFTPLILARTVQLGVALLMIWAARSSLPSLRGNRIALLAGVLDASGNIFYVLAKQFMRLDVAAVLASLYPASTVLLASILLKEKVSFSQGIGLAVCLLAIVLITG